MTSGSLLSATPLAAGTLAALAAGFKPALAQALVALAREKPGRCLALGFPAAFAAALAGSILLRAALGGPAGSAPTASIALAFFAVLLCGALASAAVAIPAAGTLFRLNFKERPFVCVCAGFAALSVAAWLPYLGDLVQLGALSWGAGAIILQGRQRGQAPLSTLAILLLAVGGNAADLGGRLDEVSASFLGAPYQLGPLGEGPQGEFDRDPLVRYDRFDCTTYVETSAALALAPDRAKAEKLLQKLRYKGGKISFETRRHFTAADWVPGLIQEGYLKDVTRAVAGDKTKTAAKVIKKRDWYRSMSTSSLEGFSGAPAAELERRAADLRLRGERLKDQPASLPYLPIENLPELLEKIPDGTIASLVREDRPDKPVLVTHQVFIFRREGRAVVRHAAFGRKVEEQDALAYFYKYFNAKWPLVGLNLTAVVPR